MKSGYCIYIDTIREGPKPAYRDSIGHPAVYPALIEAQRMIAKATIERIREFLDGDRSFEQAMTVEQYVVEVDVLSDGSVVDADGNHFTAGR